MRFFNCSTPKDKKSTFAFYTLLCISAGALGLGFNVAVEALEKNYALNMDFDEIVTTSDLATAVVTCAVFLFLQKIMLRYQEKFQSPEAQPLVINDPEISFCSLKMKKDHSSVGSFKKYASESANIILSVGMGAGSGIGVDVLEKKYIGDMSLGYLTISDVATSAMTLAAYGFFSKLFDKCCLPKKSTEDDDRSHSQIFYPNL